MVNPSSSRRETRLPKRYCQFWTALLLARLMWTFCGILGVRTVPAHDPSDGRDVQSGVGLGAYELLQLLGRTPALTCLADYPVHRCARNARRAFRFWEDPGGHPGLRHQSALASHIPTCQFALDQQPSRLRSFHVHRPYARRASLQPPLDSFLSCTLSPALPALFCPCRTGVGGDPYCFRLEGLSLNKLSLVAIR